MKMQWAREEIEKCVEREGGNLKVLEVERSLLGESEV